MKYLRRYMISIAALLIVSGIFLTVYTVGQQILRMDANEPQTQLAEDAAARLDAGANPKDVVGNKVDIAKSLAPWVIVYTRGGGSAASSAYRQNAVPTQFWSQNEEPSMKERSVTYEPYEGLRFATVTVPAKDYIVLSGRSMREVEKNEQVVLALSAMGWLGSVFVILVATAVSSRTRSS